MRASAGALSGVALTGSLAHWLSGSASISPYLIAPMGASAVLLFAVPASPLAQPWSIIGGNLIAATVGVTSALLLHDPITAAAVAIARRFAPRTGTSEAVRTLMSAPVRTLTA